MALWVTLGFSTVAVILLGVHAAGLVTTHWFGVITTDNETLHIGLFMVCQADSTCDSYAETLFTKNGPSLYFIVIVCCYILATIFYIATLLVCIVHAFSNRMLENTFVGTLGGLWGITAVAIIFVFIPIFNNFDENDFPIASDSVTSFHSGYSFYLAVLTGVLTSIVAIAVILVSA